MEFSREITKMRKGNEMHVYNRRMNDKKIARKTEISKKTGFPEKTSTVFLEIEEKLTNFGPFFLVKPRSNKVEHARHDEKSIRSIDSGSDNRKNV